MKKLFLVLFFFLLIALCGCDYREIDRGYLVSAIGFAREEQSVKIYIEAISSSDVEDKPSERVVLSGDGVSLQNAFENLTLKLVKPLYFEQLGSAVFEDSIQQEGIEFLRGILDINHGIYLVKTDDIENVFNEDYSKGMLGYDIIGLIKTNSGDAIQLYQTNRSNFNLPTVNLADGNLIFKALGDTK